MKFHFHHNDEWCKTRRPKQVSSRELHRFTYFRPASNAKRRLTLNFIEGITCNSNMAEKKPYHQGKKVLFEEFS